MSYCDCDNRPEFYQESDQKSRKVRVCYECQAQINIGDTYRKASGKWEGEFQSYSFCEKCGDLCDSLAELGYCWTFGQLHETHQEIIR